MIDIDERKKQLLLILYGLYKNDLKDLPFITHSPNMDYSNYLKKAIQTRYEDPIFYTVFEFIWHTFCKKENDLEEPQVALGA